MAKKQLSPREIVIAILVLAAVAAWYRWGPTDEGGASPGGGTSTTEAPRDPGQGKTADRTGTRSTKQPAGTSSASSGEAEVLKAFRAKRSDVQVEVEGRVVFIFPPDRDGKPHQRFLLELPSGHTLKIAHNLTLSKPVPLRKGDTVRLYGEYEYNVKGGVVHWTHRDPRNRHPHGWIRHEGKVYR